MKRRRLVSFLVLAVFILQIGFVNPITGKATGTTTTTSNPKAKIFLNKTVDKNQWGENEEFTVSYTIQPQDIPQNLVDPSLYQKNGADISLVIDTSGSMGWNLKGDNQFGYTLTYVQDNDGDYVRVYNDSRTIYGKYCYRYLGYSGNIQEYVCFDQDYDDFIPGLYYKIRYDKGATHPYIKHGNRIYYVDLNTRYSQTYVTEKSRMDIVKGAANNFIDKFKNYSNVNIGLIGYADYAYTASSLTSYTGFDAIRNIINNSDDFKPGGATNIGDGLRRGYYQLKDYGTSGRKRFIILLTDGEPTYYSYYKNSYAYVTDNRSYYGDSYRSTNYYIDGGGNNDYDGKSTEYANTISRIIANDKTVTPYMIAFSKDAVNNKLKGICDTATGSQQGFYKEATSENDLNDIYERIAQSILSDLPVYSLQFKETFPDGIDIVSYSNGLRVDSSNSKTIIGDIGNINYKLDKVNKVFKADPVTFWVKVKGTKAGDYVLGKDASGNSTSYVTYKDIDGKAVNPAPSFPAININIYDNEPPKMDANLTSTDGTNYNLGIGVNKPSDINVRLTKDGPIIASQQHANDTPTNGSEDDAYNYNIQIPFNLVKNNTENNLYIEAIDKDGRKTVETVPWITTNIVDKQGNYDVNIQTETNTSIDELKVNGSTLVSDKITDNGTYTCNTDKFIDGDNTVSITVSNGYNNTTTITFKKTFDLKSILMKYGIFLSTVAASPDKHLAPLSSSNELKIINTLTTKIGFKIQAENLKSYIQLIFATGLSTKINNFELYDMSQPTTNGIHKLVKIGSKPSIGKDFYISDVVDASKLEKGKSYMLVCSVTFTVNNSNLNEINKKDSTSGKTNNFIINVDGVPSNLNLIIAPRPKVK